MEEEVLQLVFRFSGDISTSVFFSGYIFWNAVVYTGGAIFDIKFCC